jgi:hypothetical protein
MGEGVFNRFIGGGQGKNRVRQEFFWKIVFIFYRLGNFQKEAK